jgi:hypothetical protein
MNFVHPATEAFDDHALDATVRVACPLSLPPTSVPLNEPMKPGTIKLFQRWETEPERR